MKRILALAASAAWLVVFLACFGVLGACQSGSTAGMTASPVAPATAPSVAPATATVPPATEAPTAPSSVPPGGTIEACPPLPATQAPTTPSSVPTYSLTAVPPPFLYISQTELLQYSRERGPTPIADLSAFGGVLHAIRLDDLVLVLRQQGLQRVRLMDGSSDLVVPFDPPARFGGLMPLDDGSVLYQVAVDDPQATAGVRTVIGLFQPQSSSGRIVLSAEQNMTVLGQTADGKGLYLLPCGQDPSFSRALEVSLATGETTAKLAISGDPFAGLSPDRQLIITTMQGGYLILYDLTPAHRSVHAVTLPEAPSHTRSLLWAADGYVYFPLLAGDFYDFDPDNPPASYGLWRLDTRTGKLCQITQGSRQERQLLAVSPDGKTLLTSDLQGALLFWDTNTGQVTAEVSVPRGELYAIGPSPDGQWLLLRHTTESIAVLVHLPSGTGDSFALPGAATFAGWR